MVARPKPYALNGGHTSGIFADMTVDGPEIGTLVTVVDRAKNLPNRKTIGKQDPYCAARLGKEAKKTATNVRGGQTPKWDQELRFTVHDSPDYYQLKMSVFTDDKKTDLIGEAWIDLKGIIVPGGGQNDMWQSLSCKGKYAGEIRLEITYYDSRPKPPEKKRQPTASEQAAAPPSATQRPSMARRPLPSDPVTGEAPAPPPPAPLPAAAQSTPEHHHQTPPRLHASFPSQSPLQATRYPATPPSQATRQQPDPYSPSPQPGYPIARVDGPRPATQRSRESFDTPPRHFEERSHGQKPQVSPFDQPDPRRQRSPLPECPEMPTGNDMEEAPPPPPPAHRSRLSSGGQELAQRSCHDISPQKSTPSAPMRHDVLRSEAHRHSAASYPGRPTFRAYDPAAPSTNSPPAPHHPEASPPRYHSYDAASEPLYRSMQATVEDAPESPPGPLTSAYRHGASRMKSHDEIMFEAGARPGPLDLGRSPDGSPHYVTSQSPGNMTGYSYPELDGHPASVSPLSLREHPNSLVYHPHGGNGHRPNSRQEYEPVDMRKSTSYSLPDVPVSLSPGLDPGLSQEISEQVYEERRHDSRYASSPVAASKGARHGSERLPSYDSSGPGYVPHSYDGRSDMTYSGAPDSQLVRQRNGSPNASASPQHTIPRKSVSPTPPLAENRMLSDVPFGPDSYDALNPSMSSPRDANPTKERVDMGGKIITHDGREVDPSDHLPMETWAPEPEPKLSQRQASPESRIRPSPAGAQPMPPSGRRPLRVARPQANTAPSVPYSYSEGPRTPPAANSAGRNRLQKKTNHGSADPTPAMSSPLAPVSTDNFQDRQSPYTPTSRPHRGGSWDFPNENHVPYDSSGPPIPAKIPLPVMSGAIGGTDAALMQEMQRIDIGAGRSRRRGGY